MANKERIRLVLEAAESGDFASALSISNESLKDHQDCPYCLVLHSMLIRLDNSEVLAHSLEDAEQALLLANSVDKSYLPALEELAHYYDAINPDPVKARSYATQYIEKTRGILERMQAIASLES